MKIDRYKLKAISIKVFANMYDLTMEVYEETFSGYMAGFKNIMTFDYDKNNEPIGDVIKSWSCGSTEQKAILAYASSISGRVLVYEEEGEIGTIFVPKLQDNGFFDVKMEDRYEKC